MVRRCAVSSCNESDQTLLAHRFPKTIDMAERWRNILNLKEHSIDDLQKKFVVSSNGSN